MVVALLISSYMLLDPAAWLYDLMGLTPLADEFKAFLLALAAGGFCCAYAAERYVFPRLAKGVGRVKLAAKRVLASGKDGETEVGKRRKAYKVIEEGMRF